MRTLTLTTPALLPTVETARPQLLASRGEEFFVEVPTDATDVRGAGGDDPLLTVRWRDAVVLFVVHREVGVMTARDYGAEMFGVVRKFVPTGRDFDAAYGSLAGRDSPLMRRTTGDRSIVAMCASPGVNRIIVIGSSPAGDDAASAEVMAVITSLTLASAADAAPPRPTEATAHPEER